MRAPIEAIPVAPGSSRKVEQKTAGASSGVFGASSGVLVNPNQETFKFRERESVVLLWSVDLGARRVIDI